MRGDGGIGRGAAALRLSPMPACICCSGGSRVPLPGAGLRPWLRAIGGCSFARSGRISSDGTTVIWRRTGGEKRRTRGDAHHASNGRSHSGATHDRRACCHRLRDRTRQSLQKARDHRTYSDYHCRRPSTLGQISQWTFGITGGTKDGATEADSGDALAPGRPSGHGGQRCGSAHARTEPRAGASRFAEPSPSP